MATTPIETVSDLLEEFDLSDLRSIIHEQVFMKEDNPNICVPDNFQPIYYKWNTIQKDPMVSDEIKEEANNRMEEFCKIILTEIKDMFNLSYDEERLYENRESLPGITLCLYAVFVLNLQSNLIDVIDNYIFKNKIENYPWFEELKIKKDASTISHKKGLNLTNAVIASNIYDIGEIILTDIARDPLSFFDYLNPDYFLKNSIKELFNEGYISGNFMEKIRDIFINNLSLKSYVCFEVISSIKNGK